MSIWLFILCLIGIAHAAEPDRDPQYCAYWLAHFDEITHYERSLRREIEWSHPEDQRDFEREVRARIRAIIQRDANDVAH